MSTNVSFRSVMVALADSIAATFASLWPRSAPSLEARRLLAEGYEAGQLADVYYLASFDESVPDDALAAIRAAGFAIREPAPASGFVTVRARLRLGAYDLTIAGLRLDHAIDPFGGFATLIGAARMNSDENSRAVRAANRSVAAV